MAGTLTSQKRAVVALADFGSVPEESKRWLPSREQSFRLYCWQYLSHLSEYWGYSVRCSDY